MLLEIISIIFRIIEFAILAECIASWVPQLRYSQFMEIVYKITTPILEPCRRLQDRLLGNLPIDFSPFIAMIILDVIRVLLINLLY
ncbi:YggT family protein [uncultured Clostridium sp.]|uniref:YggT family protein n=1 Tax=uncultured Clostridium sp. TaxID=59620 RepID=UPI0025F83D42|nr:YggT family protein [uncultured Clostridium sp.]